jgi:hypothetical protein
MHAIRAIVTNLMLRVYDLHRSMARKASLVQARQRTGRNRVYRSPQPRYEPVLPKASAL